MPRTLALVLVAVLAARAIAADAGPLDIARLHLQKGRYEEALEIYDGQTAADPQQTAVVAVGRSECLAALGRLADATDTLEKAVAAAPNNANLLARLGELRLARGEYDDAQKAAEQALALDPDEVRARLVQADVFTRTGRLTEAANAYRWFVRFYNRAQPKDAESLILVAEGSAVYARWQSASQIFSFLVNTVCPDALRVDPLAWRGHYVSGSLLLEKYNSAQAIPELKKALAINPRAVPVLVALGRAALQEHDLQEAERYADQALETNPVDVAALCLKAEARLRSGDVTGAETLANRALETNPVDDVALAHLAACYLLQDGEPPRETLESLLLHLDAIEKAGIEPPDRFTEVLIKVARRNPRPGQFLATLAETLENRRRFELAERFYRAAIAAMPQLAEPKTALGMLYMSIGRTDEARTILDEAFQADPYHVRVSNMRKVLRLLDGYETIATDHFVIRVDSKADRILGRYMAEYLEEIYPELVAKFGYEPEHRTTFEIYHNAKGLSAHQWFSARMIGLPWIQTIGASTGVIVALASPTAADEPYNWARVLKHEFVHIITMQKTGFRIPHWFTEALAVESEQGPFPELWNELLAERVPRGEIRTLTTLDEAFVRPASSRDWQFAYCQSRLYTLYMQERFGAATIPKLLDAYRDNMSTAEAIPHVFQVDLETFEAGYREYLKQRVAVLPQAEPGDSKSLAELEKEYRAEPNNPQKAAAFAAALLQAGDRRRAVELARKVLATNPAEPRAALIVALVEIRSGNPAEARRVLERALDLEKPHRLVLELLARLKLAAGSANQAAELYALGHNRFPRDVDLARGLVDAYTKSGEKTRIKQSLEDLAALDPDDHEARTARARIALEEQDYARALEFGRAALHIEVLDPDLHRLLAETYTALGDHGRAIRELEVALELKPDEVEIELALARAHLKAGDPAKSRAVLDSLLKRRPDNAEAKQLREQTGPAASSAR